MLQPSSRAEIDNMDPRFRGDDGGKEIGDDGRAGFTGVSGGGSDTQARIGVGLGTKIPFADRLATRLELNYGHAFSSSNSTGGNEIGASIGLSFFTR